MIARAVIDALSFAFWLSDPDIDLIARVARSMNLRLASSFEFGKLMKANGADVPIEGILAADSAHGLVVLRPKGRPPALIKPIPGSTDLARSSTRDV